jgi:hypothetical protein
MNLASEVGGVPRHQRAYVQLACRPIKVPIRRVS